MVTIKRYELHINDIEPAIDDGIIQACYNIMMANSHKGNSWIDRELSTMLVYLNQKLQEEFEEYQAIQYNHSVKVSEKMHELCDIINVASMLYRRYRRMI